MRSERGKERGSCRRNRISAIIETRKKEEKEKEKEKEREKKEKRKKEGEKRAYKKQEQEQKQKQKKGALGAFYFVEAATEDSRGLGLTNEGIGVDVFYYF